MEGTLAFRPIAFTPSLLTQMAPEARATPLTLFFGQYVGVVLLGLNLYRGLSTPAFMHRGDGHAGLGLAGFAQGPAALKIWLCPHARMPAFYGVTAVLEGEPVSWGG